MHLAPYQLRLLRDPTRQRFVCASRRVGKSWSITLAAALRLLGLRIGTNGGIERDPDGPTDQLLISHSEPAAIDLLTQVADHVRTLIASRPELTILEDHKKTLVLSNGATAYALADNPRTLRSHGGDVTWDECAFSRDAAEVWKSIKSITDATIARPQGYRLTMATTAWVADGIIYEIAKGDGSKSDRFRHFSRHTWPLPYAVRHGFPRAMDTKQQLAFVAKRAAEFGDDEIAFGAEYLCHWIDGGSLYIPKDLIDRCRYTPEEFPGADSREMTAAGIDIGRKRHLTAIGKVTRDARGKLYLHASETMAKATFEMQHQRFKKLREEGVTSMAMDATGLGLPVFERLQGEIDGIEGVTFSAEIKSELASTVKMLMEEGRLLLPVDDKDLAREFSALRRTPTANGWAYDGKSGMSHCDRFWASALGVRAARVAQPWIWSGMPMTTSHYDQRPSDPGSWRARFRHR